jgi:hypothetical protein
MGEYDRAVAALEGWAGSPTATDIVWAGLAYSFAKAGRRAEAEGILRNLMQESQNRFVSPRAIAWVHTGLGNLDDAVAWFQRAIAVSDGGVNTDFVMFVGDDLRTHAGFEELLRMVRLEG